jgi:hypothetical protein
MNLAGEVEFKKILGDSPPEDKTRLAELLLRYVSYQIQAQLRESQTKPFRYLDGYWSARLANNGSTTLTGVVVNLPGTTYASIRREGVEPVFGDSSDVITVGSMRPGEVVGVQAWSRYGTSVYHARDVRVTHERGIGDTVIYAPVGWIGQIADRYWPLVAWLLFSGLAGTAIMVIGQYLDKRSRTTRGTEGKRVPPKEADESTS